MKIFAVVSLSLGLLFSLTALAQIQAPGCNMSRNYKFNFWLSYENQKQGLFGATADTLPPTVIDNCKTASGKYLGLGLGLRQPFLSSDTADVSFDGVLRPEVCEIKNLEASTAMPFSEKESRFKEQFHTLRQCAYLEITQIDNKPIQYNSSQKFCQIEKLSNGKLKLIGDFCYLKITPDLRIAVSIAVKPDCINPEFLKKNNIQLTDLEALLQAFVVEDDQAFVTENMVGTTKVRMSLLPSSKIMSVNKDLGPDEPQFPNQFLADVQMGQIKISDDEFNGEPASVLDLSLLLDTRAPRKCVDGFCASPADYQVPIVAEIELHEIKNGKRTLMDVWYAGNAADPFVKPQWQGLFSMGRKVAEGGQLKPNSVYELKFNFYNPYDDYLMLVRRYQQLLVDLTLLNGTAGKDIIQAMSGLVGLLGLPQLPTLPALGTSDINDQLEKVRQYFRRIGADMQFPPYYETACNNTYVCQKLNSKLVTQLTTQFTLTEKDPSTQVYGLKNVKTSRQSAYLSSYEKTNVQLPEIQCH